MRKLNKAMIIVMLVLMLAMPAFAFAEVTSVAEDGGPEGYIYVAGNPDLYPIESYNPDKGVYEGIMPELLEIISKKTGLDFCYISGSTINRQAKLIANNQVEIATAYTNMAELSKMPADSYLTFSYNHDGLSEDAYIIFTDIASAELRNNIKAAFSEISQEEISRIAITYTMSHDSRPRQRKIIYFMLGLIAVLILLIIIIRSSSRRYNQQKEADKYVDKITGINNRSGFLREFDTKTAGDARLLYYANYFGFDIAHINKYYGTGVSENMLRAMAKILSEDKEFITGRVAGGAIAAAFEAANPNEAMEITEKLLYEMNEACEAMVDFKGDIVEASLCPLSNITSNGSQVLNYLTEGYRIAINSKQQLILCTEEVIHNIDEAQQLGEHVLEALKNDEIRAYIQVIVDAKSGNIVGGETLSRWENPTLGLISPGRFIGAVNQRGLTEEFDYYMFRETCKCLENWKNIGYEELVLTCNFTRLTISELDFTERIRNIASRYDFDHDRLIMEITEDSLEKNKSIAIKNITECKEMGYIISMDDVGEGYTSFVNFYDYPVDVIKIDRTIVVSARDEKGLGLTEALIAMAHSMDMKVICEGVEDEALDRIIRDTDCDYLQGYYYLKAVPPEECIRFIEEHNMEIERNVDLNRSEKRKTEESMEAVETVERIIREKKETQQAKQAQQDQQPEQPKKPKKPYKGSYYNGTFEIEEITELRKRLMTGDVEENDEKLFD